MIHTSTNINVQFIEQFLKQIVNFATLNNYCCGSLALTIPNKCVADNN